MTSDDHNPWAHFTDLMLLDSLIYSHSRTRDDYLRYAEEEDLQGPGAGDFNRHCARTQGLRVRALEEMAARLRAALPCAGEEAPADAPLEALPPTGAGDAPGGGGGSAGAGAGCADAEGRAGESGGGGAEAAEGLKASVRKVGLYRTREGSKATVIQIGDFYAYGTVRGWYRTWDRWLGAHRDGPPEGPLDIVGPWIGPETEPGTLAERLTRAEIEGITAHRERQIEALTQAPSTPAPGAV